MKKIYIGFLVFVLVFVSGCNNDDLENYMAYYENEIYEEVFNWNIVGEVVSEEKAWVGFEKELTENPETNDTVMLHKNDPNAIFLSHDNHLSDPDIFHKKSDPLPKYYSEKVEKIVLYAVEGHDDIVIQGSILSEFREFFLKCEQGADKIPTEKWDDPNLAGINIYYQNYPAYYYFGLLGRSKSGKLCISSSEIPGLDFNSVYVVLPDNLAEYINKQMS